MQITFKKNPSRHQLICSRKDGTTTSIDLGPQLPYHDLAHYVIESYCKFDKGFFGHIKEGESLQEMNSTETIQNLDPQVMIAEVFTRNLQALGSGSSRAEDFIELIRWELTNQNFPELSLEEVLEVKSKYLELCKQWEELETNDSISLNF